MANNHWLVKQEPSDYAWVDFQKTGGTDWTGVRNFQARNHLRAMKEGELVLFYHSGAEKQIVGVARVAQAAFPDPTAQEGDWSAVRLVPVQPLARPVPLAAMKSDPALEGMPLFKQSRLSVMPLTERHFKRLLRLADTRI